MLRLAAGLVALAAAANPAAPQAAATPVSSVATLARVPSDVPVFPVENLKPGMKGVGRTVFANQKLETFEVEIIGALENSAPRQTMVMARLTGGPLASPGRWPYPSRNRCPISDLTTFRDYRWRSDPFGFRVRYRVNRLKN